MTESFDEPSIPPRLRRPLTAVWISLALHGALIALIQVAPPTSFGEEAPTIEARLVLASPATATPITQPEPPRPAAIPQSEPVLIPRPAAEPLLTPRPEAPSPPPLPAPPAASPVPAPAATLPPAAVPAAPAPTAALTSAVDLTYYSVRELDVQPRALREIEPDYPAEADRLRISGKVRVQLRLEADGRVSDVVVLSATPPKWFEETTLRAFRDARFAPARKNGRAVRAQVVIEVEYDWEGR